jgi:hypothetical protein
MWNSHALVPVNASYPAGPSQLATPPWAEAYVFAEPHGMGIAWDKLKELEMPVGFVMCGNANWTYGEGATREMVWRPKLSSNERMMDAGHMVSKES